MAVLQFRCESRGSVWYEAAQLSVSVRCRRCIGCLRLRRYQWMCRAAAEQMSAKATWFFTFTYGPEARASILGAASNAADRTAPQAARLVRAAGVSVSAYMRHLRKIGGRVRYLAVPEPHRNGFPHWHGLVHCLSGDLSHETLTLGWSHGWSVFKAVRDVGAIRYVTKYLAKERFGRVRASLKYGARDLDQARTAAGEDGVDLSTCLPTFDVKEDHELPCSV